MRLKTDSIAYFPAMYYTSPWRLKMNAWRVFVLGWYLDRKIKKARSAEKKPDPHADIDLEPKWETSEPPKERKISGYLAFVFLIAAVICFSGGWFLLGLLSIFALSGALFWPYV
jgi:hypothetical protein